MKSICEKECRKPSPNCAYKKIGLLRPIVRCPTMASIARNHTFYGCPSVNDRQESTYRTPSVPILANPSIKKKGSPPPALRRLGAETNIS